MNYVDIIAELHAFSMKLHDERTEWLRIGNIEKAEETERLLDALFIMRKCFRPSDYRRLSPSERKGLFN
ncbi:hypothetical protein RUESEDTHA_03599 [Ruegeria sp. THAF57]|nr:hypothetical protein RUESEDTHA_03599 [Ruegeria sp. THAF57]